MDWFHNHVWQKKTQEGYIRSEESQPSPGFQCQEYKFPTTSGCKNQWGLSWWKKVLEPQAVPLKEPKHGAPGLALAAAKPAAHITYSDSLPLSSSTGVAA